VLAAVAPWSWYLLRDHWVFMEPMAVLLPAFVAVATALGVGAALVLHRRSLLALAAGWALFGAVTVLLPWTPAGTDAPAQGVRVVVANVLHDNPEPQQVVDDILGSDPDIAVVPEASLQVHRRLAERYPTALRTEVPGPGMGVYTRLPATQLPPIPGLLEDGRFERLRIEGPDGPFVLYALHLPRPWFKTEESSQVRPGAHDALIDRFRAAMAAEDLPVVIAGDLNLTDRGRSYRKLLEGRRDAMRAGWGGPTEIKLLFRPLFLTIDHVLVPDDWCAADTHRLHLAASDHRGIRASIGPCRD
jgi:endonuclease/exonuclease/phosphatase (EEP) superfamily protein YafD